MTKQPKVNKNKITTIIFILCIQLIVISCNVTFFVDSDKVVRKLDGFIIIGSHGLDVSFIPLKIDPSLTITQNLMSVNVLEAHQLVDLGTERVRYLRFLAEKADPSYYIIPVELEYREIFGNSLHYEGGGETKYAKMFKLDSTLFKIKQGRKYLVYIKSTPFYNYETINQRNLEYILDK